MVKRPGGKAALYEVRHVPVHSEPRGLLSALEFGALPFTPRRIFVVQAVPPGITRGHHAHRRTRLFLVCPAGAVRVDLHRPGEAATEMLDSPTKGLLIPPGVWSAQTYCLPGTILLVLASEPYDAGDYVILQPQGRSKPRSVQPRPNPDDRADVP